MFRRLAAATAATAMTTATLVAVTAVPASAFTEPVDIRISLSAEMGLEAPRKTFLAEDVIVGPGPELTAEDLQQDDGVCGAVEVDIDPVEETISFTAAEAGCRVALISFAIVTDEDFAFEVLSNELVDYQPAGESHWEIDSFPSTGDALGGAWWVAGDQELVLSGSTVLSYEMAAPEPPPTEPGEAIEGPVLDLVHALPGGGMNLWRMPLGADPADRGIAYLQRRLEGGGWSYHGSTTASGHFRAAAGTDAGTPDQLVVHRQVGGGVLLWVVPGDQEAAPEVWSDLRSGGWDWGRSRHLVGDVDGDGWDDVVSLHLTAVAPGEEWVNVWVHRNVGGSFAAPELWQTIVPRASVGGRETDPHPSPFIALRFLLGDVDGDTRADLVSVHRGAWADAILYGTWLNTGTTFAPPTSVAVADAFGGWSFGASRDLLADVDGDGTTELLTVHAQAGGGILIWQRDQDPAGKFSGEASVLANLRTGGWSFDSSQHVADLDGDGDDDLVSVHSNRGLGGGILVWTHESVPAGDGVILAEPQLLSDLTTGGWSAALTRASTATYRSTD